MRASWNVAWRAAMMIIAALLLVAPGVALAQGTPARQDTFSPEELIQSGHKAFGNVSRGLALTIEEAVRRWGEPNGYIVGQEASGAFIGGLRYGEGVLYTRNAGDQRVFWQGPSVGLDFGGDGARTMMLVYNLPTVNALFQRFAGINGSAYLVGRLRHDGTHRQRHHHRTHPYGGRRPPRPEPRVSQVHARGDVESLLSVRPERSNDGCLTGKTSRGVPFS
jgi:Uncharacterized protein conserved in bacteria